MFGKTKYVMRKITIDHPMSEFYYSEMHNTLNHVMDVAVNLHRAVIEDINIFRADDEDESQQRYRVEVLLKCPASDWGRIEDDLGSITVRDTKKVKGLTTEIW